MIRARLEQLLRSKWSRWAIAASIAVKVVLVVVAVVSSSA